MKFLNEPLNSQAYNAKENSAFLCGLSTKPSKAAFSEYHAMGINLYPIAAKLVLGIPSSKLVDQAVNANDILENDLVDMMENSLRELPDFNSRAIWLENLFCSTIKSHPDFSLALKISKLLDQITQKRVNKQPVDLYNLTGYSRMHTYRIFKDWFGLSPSQAVSLRQFTNSIEQMNHGDKKLIQLALDNGYYDQSHFIRMFKQYADMTPVEYLKGKIEIAGQVPL